MKAKASVIPNSLRSISADVFDADVPPAVSGIIFICAIKKSIAKHRRSITSPPVEIVVDFETEEEILTTIIDDDGTIKKGMAAYVTRPGGDKLTLFGLPVRVITETCEYGRTMVVV